MPEAMPFELRIYCLCGQRMKVTSDMLGKPGKCIACRQKIRIPAEEELGPDEVVIHLKDHPEFLRKPKRRDTAGLPAFDDESQSDLDRDDLLLEGDSDQLAAVAFERFEPIRRLCNYEHKVRTQLQCIREGRPAELDKATLMSYRGLARQSRQQLEGVIREELISIATELQRIRDELGDLQLALRSGDTEHVAYSKAVLPLRQRREVLVYRHQNLRGWLATEDPHVAGGLDDVSLADVPVDLADGPFPLENEIDGLPIEHAVIRLEQALRERERADKLLNELHRMSLDGVIAVDELARRRADTEAERQRARAAVAFYRGRLEQVIQDCEEDSSALNAYEEAMQKKLESAAIAKDVFGRLEETIFRAQVDVKRARKMALRALNANAVSDVPNPHGTFLERLARPGGLRSLGADSWLAWVASTLLLVGVFLPIATEAPGGIVAATFHGHALALLGLATLVALSATVVIRPLRGTLLNVLWLVLTLGGAIYLSSGLPGEADGDAWWAAGGGLPTLGAWGVLGVAAIVSLFSLGMGRWLALANVTGGIVVAGLILGNIFGPAQPAPELGNPVIELDALTGTYAVQIPIRNAGRAAFQLGGKAGGTPLASTCVLEYKIGVNSWADAGLPTGITLGGKELAYSAEDGVSLAPGERVVFTYKLPPGVYRLQVVPTWDGAMPLQKTFQLQPPDPAEVRAADREAAPVLPSSPQKTKGVDIELRGVLDGEDSDPIFSVIIHEPDGTEQKEQFGLGDTIYGEWTISEFSPEHNTMTVINGNRLLIIERGKVETLD